MFKNTKIRFRILLGYSVPLLLIMITAAAVFASLNMYTTAHKQTTRSIATFDKSNEMYFVAANLQRYARGYLLDKNEQSMRNYEDTKKRFESVSQFLSSFLEDEQLKALHLRVMEKDRQMIRITDQLMLLVNEGRTGDAIAEFRNKNLIKLDTEVTALNIEFDVREKLLLANAQKEQEQALGRISLSLLIGVFLTFVFSLLSGMLIANGITRNIAEAINAVSSAATEIAATANQHERMASQQAAMVNETATTMQELGVSSRQTAEQASSAAASTRVSLSSTGEGTVIIKQTIEGMNTLGVKVGVIAAQVLSLSEQTAQIGNLANMVKELAGEINMLALNAAVEAARAGEYGKGFAVVAGEVRKLASESKKSGEQANAIIADIQKATNATILRTEEGTKVVETVTALSRDVGVLFDSLSGTANDTYENAQQVLLNAQQQSKAISQVVDAVNVLNAGARETATGITQTKTGIEQLKITAANLKLLL